MKADITSSEMYRWVENQNNLLKLNYIQLGEQYQHMHGFVMLVELHVLVNKIP